MKRIIQDTMHRFWWLWPIVFGIPLVVAALDNGNTSQVALLWILFYSAFLSFGFIIAVSKTLLTLPLGRKQIGQSVWLLCAVLPPALATADQAILYLVRVWNPKLDLLPPHLFLICLFLFVGSMGAVQMLCIFQMWFFKRTGIRRNILFGMLHIAPMPLAIIFIVRFCVNPGDDLFNTPGLGRILGAFGKRQFLFDGTNLTALIAAAIFTFWSWIQRHQILGAFFALSKSDADGFFFPRRIRTAEYSSRAAGRFLLCIMAAAASVITAALLVLTFCGVALGAFLDPNTEFVLESETLAFALSMAVTMLLYIVSLPWIFSIRTLRALPMTRFHLAFHILFSPIVAQVVIMGLTCAILPLVAFLHLDLAASLTLELKVFCFVLAGLACFTLPRIGVVVGGLYWSVMFLGGAFLCAMDFSTATLPWIAVALPLAIVLGLVGIYRFIGSNYSALRRYQEMVSVGGK